MGYNLEDIMGQLNGAGVIVDKLQKLLEQVYGADQNKCSIGEYDNKLHFVQWNLKAYIIGVLYYSPKYDRYQSVYIRNFYRYMSSGFGIKTIYRRGTEINTSNLNSKGINPEQLDVYYDTVYGSSDYELYVTRNADDDRFYDQYGIAIEKLLTMQFDIDLNVSELDQYKDDLYITSSSTMIESNTNVDNIDAIDDSDRLENGSENGVDYINYKIDNYVDGVDDTNQILSNCHLYQRLDTLFNHYSGGYNKIIHQINNEYGFILSGTNQNISRSCQWINSIGDIVSIYDNKSIHILPNNTNNEITLNSNFVERFNFMYNIYSGNYNNNESGIVSYDEQTIYIGLPLQIESMIKNYKLTNFGNYYNSIGDKYVNIGLDSTNIVDTNFLLFSNNVEIYTRSNALKMSYTRLGKFTNNQCIIRDLHQKGYYKKINISDSITLDEPLSGEIYAKDLVIDGNLQSLKSNESYFISQNEADLIGIDSRFNLYNYQLYTYQKASLTLIRNSIVDDNRFVIYGAAINADKTNMKNLQYNLRYHRFNEIDLVPYPIPLETSRVANANIVTESLSTKINDRFLEGSQQQLASTAEHGRFDITQKKIFIDNQVNSQPTSYVPAYDRQVYTEYNKNKMVYNAQDLMGRQGEKYFVFLLYDTVTDNFDKFIVKCKPKYNGMNTVGASYRTMNTTVERKVLVDTEHSDLIKSSNWLGDTALPTVIEDTWYNKKLEIKKITSIYSEFIGLKIQYVRYNKTTKELETIDSNVELTALQYDSATTKQTLDIGSLEDVSTQIIVKFNYQLNFNLPYKIWSYFDNYQCKLYRTFSYCTFEHNVNVVSRYIRDNNSISYINLYSANFKNCLPQNTYTKNLSLSLFDIDDDLQNFVPDNKKCLVFNNFINNETTEVLLSDATSYDTTDVAIIDGSISYKKLDRLYKILPHLENVNVDKYVKVQLKLDIHELSSDLFTGFTYSNLYDVSLFDDEKGALLLEGKITDIIDIDNFIDLLKEYRLSLSFTVNHNINNSINVPVKAHLKCEIYDTESDFLSNTPLSVKDLHNTILIELRNRGDLIDSDTDWFPKILENYEYYETYPQYSWQNEVLHPKTLEIKLSSLDVNLIKVSELYFDILYKTDDVQIAIPNNYESGTIPDPENEIDDVTYSQDKNEILDYFNWLIRFKCPNCTNVHIKLNLIIRPKYFGFNIGSLNLGCYSHNIKLEWFVPYIFYKASADTVMVIDAKNVIEKKQKAIDLSLRQNFQNSQQSMMGAVNALMDNGGELTNSIKYVDAPDKSKLTLILFNSSFYKKDIKLELIDNNSPKTIQTTELTYPLDPLEFKIVSLEESISASDYNDSFNSGFVTYEMTEFSYKDNTEKHIDNFQMAIPSLDEYIRVMLNFFSKVAKAVTIDCEKNVVKLNMANEEAKTQEIERNSVQVINTSNSITNVEFNNGISDIDFKFYINETYELIVDRRILDDYLEQINNNFGDTIYIKVPLIVDSITGDYSINGTDYNTKNDSPIIELNNLYDSNAHYLYLTGKRSNIDSWSFTMKGVISVKDSMLVQNIIDLYGNDELDKISLIGFTLSVPVIIPNAILKLFGWAYGQDNAGKLYNFLTSDLPTDAILNLNKFKDIYAQDTSPISQVFSCIGIHKNTPRLSFEKEKVIGIYDENSIRVMNRDSNDITYGNDSGIFNIDDENKFYTTMKTMEFAFNSNMNMPLKQTDNWDKWLFDDIYTTIFSDNIFTRTFNSSGRMTTYLGIELSEGLSEYHYMHIAIDGGHDPLLSTSIQYGGESYQFNYMGDNKITLSQNSNNTLLVDVVNFKWSTLQVTVDNNTYDMINSAYSLQNSLQRKLLQHPITLQTVDYKNNPILITSDTNYKLILEIPCQLFKATESYMTIDKIRIADNFINSTDYCVIFGDDNERFNLNSNEDKLLGKIYGKYDTSALKFIIRAFNIPNQSGQYFTSLILWYTFNGKQYSITKDVRYRIELPTVLDNEYLTATVDRIDDVEAPFTVSENGIKTDMGERASKSSLPYLLDYKQGFAGCDLSLPDLGWFNSNNGSNKDQNN